MNNVRPIVEQILHSLFHHLDQGLVRRNTEYLTTLRLNGVEDLNRPVVWLGIQQDKLIGEYSISPRVERRELALKVYIACREKDNEPFEIITHTNNVMDLVFDWIDKPLFDALAVSQVDYGTSDQFSTPAAMAECLLVFEYSLDSTRFQTVELDDLKQIEFTNRVTGVSELIEEI